jgi:hypothetical protein
MKRFARVVAFGVSLLGACLPALAQAPTTRSDVGSLRGFNVVLLVGDAGGDASRDAEIAPAVRAALDDVKAFLPFKRYRVIDSAWLPGSLPHYRAMSRLRGPNQESYQVTVRTMPPPIDSERSGALYVTFRLREVGGADAPPTSADSSKNGVIDTSFTMRMGETVVVGTSSARPGVGLIALLNAVSGR